MLDPLFQSYGVSPNSDFRPVLDLYAARDLFLGVNAAELVKLRMVAAPLQEVLGKAPPSAPLLSVTQVDNLEGAVRGARQAVAVYQCFASVGKGQKSAPAGMSKSTAQIVGNARMLHGQAHMNELAEVWFPSLHSLAWMTIPYLSTAQMEVMWRDLESARGYAGLPDQPKTWFKLYKALSARDFSQVRDCASRLLPPGEIKASTESDYLLTVAMLANIATGNCRAALELFNRYEKRAAPPLEIRLLKAHADR